MDREWSISASMLVEAIDSEAFHKLTDKRQVGHWVVRLHVEWIHVRLFVKWLDDCMFLADWECRCAK